MFPRKLIVPLLALIFVAPTAHAQIGAAAGIAEYMNPYFLRRDLKLITEIFELDEGQQAVFEAFYFEYEDSHEQGRNTTTDSFENLQARVKEGMGEEELLREVFRPFREQADRWHDNRDLLLASLRSVLNGDQLSRWDEMMRSLRLEKELGRCNVLSGESVNLRRVLRNTEIPQDAQLIAEPALVAWELAIDEALLAREQPARKAQQAIMNAMTESELKDAYDPVIELLSLDAKIRDLQEVHRGLIATAFGTWGPAFEQAALAAAYPQIYGRKNAVERIFDAALERTDLDEDTTLRVADLDTEFRAEIAEKRAAWREALVTYEQEDKVARAMRSRDRERATVTELNQNPIRMASSEVEYTSRDFAGKLLEILGRTKFSQLPGASRYLPRPARESVGSKDDPKTAKRRKMLESGKNSLKSTAGGGKGKKGGKQR